MKNCSDDGTVKIEVVIMKRIPPKNLGKEDASCAEPTQKMECESECSKMESPDKITRNPFFNFLRDFRKCNQGLLAKEVAMQGADEWNSMEAESKSKYVVQAFHAKKKYNRRNINSSHGIRMKM